MGDRLRIVLLVLGPLSLLENYCDASTTLWASAEEILHRKWEVKLAVVGGVENYSGVNRTTALLVGRANHSGVLVPCKITYDAYDPRLTVCRYSWKKHEEHEDRKFEYLRLGYLKTPDQFSWVNNDALVNFDAVVYADDDTQKYAVGRARVDGMYFSISKVDMKTHKFITNYLGYKVLDTFQYLTYGYYGKK